MEWKLNTKLKAVALSPKESTQLQKENRMIKILAILEKKRYPFTYAEEVDDYMDIDTDEEKKKQLKNTAIYAHDSTRLISVAATIFRVMNVDSDRKWLSVMASKFTENLKIMLGGQNEKVMQELIILS